jgi:predicted aspartyl protease
MGIGFPQNHKKRKVGLMGRIVASVKIENLSEPTKALRCDALVDTGASYMILPDVWRDRLGDLEEIDTLELETATQKTVQGVICGPVRIQIEGFRPIYNEVCFVNMESKDGSYEPLIGYIVLEQSQAAVDMLGHRLIHVKRMDLK